MVAHWTSPYHLLGLIVESESQGKTRACVPNGMWVTDVADPMATDYSPKARLMRRKSRSTLIGAREAPLVCEGFLETENPLPRLDTLKRSRMDCILQSTKY